MRDMVVKAEGGDEETSFLSIWGLVLFILLCHSVSPVIGNDCENRHKIPEPRRDQRALHANHDGYRWGKGETV